MVWHIGVSIELVLYSLEYCFLYKVSLASQQPCESKKMIPIILGRYEGLKEEMRNEGLEQQRPQGRDPVGRQEAASVFELQWSPPPWSSQDCFFHGRGYILGLRLGWEGAWVPSLRAQWPFGLSFIASRYNVEVKHIKIMTAEGLYRITEKKAFRGLTVRSSLPLTPAPQNLGRTLPEVPFWDHLPLIHIQSSSSKGIWD